MANQDIKQIANVTGTFPALQFKADVAASSGNVAPETGKEPPVEAKNSPDLEALAAKLNVATQSIGRDLRFKVDMDSGQSVIQVLDRDTGELIREIPPEKAQFSMSSDGEMQIRLYDALA
jgi:flagellar protein FlaG